ncbi:LacI family transcriptional regulator [Christensenellaceae bacterium]|nr:LacI family transcriptional regulator [Christensenellaceae bacterium]BDF60186.1 LacI family transcriptional regulator [Christensenellaceae bacterium]
MREIKNNNEVTIKEVAEKAGVSQATVGRVIGGYGSVSPKTRDKVLAAAKKLNYVPNAIAQSMKSKNTRTIGVVVGNIENPFFSEIVHAIERRSAEAGFHLIISNTGEIAEREVEALQLLHSKRVDGLIVATTQPANKVFDEREQRLYYGLIPTIYIDREIFGVNELCVKTDNFGGAYEVTKKFIENGHSKIGVLAGKKTSTMDQRVDGYRKALEDHGIAFNECYIDFGTEGSIEEGCNLTKRLLKNNKELTALFPLNSLICTGCLLALHKLEKKIAKDISLIAWDDFPLAKILDPPLSTMTQDTDKIGTVAIEKLLETIEGKEKGNELYGEKRITLKTRFIERESCAKIN